MEELLNKNNMLGVENTLRDINNIKVTLDNVEMILKLKGNMDIEEYKYTKMMIKKIEYEIEKVHTILAINTATNKITIDYKDSRDIEEIQINCIEQLKDLLDILKRKRIY